MPAALKTRFTDFHAPWLFMALARNNQFVSQTTTVARDPERRTMSVKRTIWICCLVACVLLVAMAAAAQVAQEKKACTVQTSTQSQFTYRKMVQSQALTQQMAQNRYAYETKNQNKTSTRKMTQSGNANGSGNGNSGNQGQQGSRSGNGRSGNG